ncbi:MAG TPA: hypothetical protein VK702_10885 [Candidatus Acidoferrum sp.]|jgi:hypothetical protein|nr:hypothetical protein [Candidatus Acidoferrum sp.]
MSDLIFHDPPVIFIGLVVIILVAVLEITYRFGGPLVRHFETNDELWNAIQTGLLALVAFMLGFSFSQAQGRYDIRRELVIKEANDIGTTWLRANQLPDPLRATFRQTLVKYTALRLQAYAAPSDPAILDRELNDSVRDQAVLWGIASDTLRAHESNLGYSLLMQTMNDTIDDSSEQKAALTQHIPVAAVGLTFLLIFVAIFSLGLSFARAGARPAVFSIIYIAAIVLVFEMVVDYDRPQTGVIRVSLAPLRWQLESMQK